MGGLLGRHKKESGKKLCSYQICPSNQQQPDGEKSTVEKQIVGKQDVPDNATKPGALEWTDVALHVPDKSARKIMNKNNSVTTPIPPPRKHRVKMENIPVEKIIPIMIKPAEKISEKLLTKQVSVEEEIIIPKKEPVHICDGTHSHVTNIVNGKIIHNEIIKPKPPQHIHPKTDSPIHSKINPTVHSRHEHNTTKIIPPVRPKNLSTVSLPNYEELTVKSKQSKSPIPKSINSKKKPKRHISVISLPTESKISLSAATAARLENYVMRCKSFGQLPPKQLLERLQHQEDFSSESDDSWEGLDEWNMEILEHEGVKTSPLVPRSRLEAPTTNLAQILTNEILLPATIEEVDEVTKRNISPIPHNTPLIDMKRSDGRRESIDDFFEAKAENPFPPNIQELKNASALGRRGSDGVYGYDKKCYPFKNPESDPNFKSDTFFSNSFLQHETQISPNDLKIRRKSAGAALHRIDSVSSDPPETPTKDPIKISDKDDDLLSTFQNFYKRNKDAVEDKSEKIIETLDKSIKPDVNVGIPQPTSIKSSDKVEHSGLLKFIQDNSADHKLKPASNDKIAFDRIPREDLSSVTH